MPTERDPLLPRAATYSEETGIVGGPQRQIDNSTNNSSRSRSYRHAHNRRRESRRITLVGEDDDEESNNDNNERENTHDDNNAEENESLVDNHDQHSDENNNDQVETEEENSIITLARRLRCLFTAITWPIVPLGTVVALALAYMLYTAFVLRNDGTSVWTLRGDPQEPCAHPLHAYAWASLLLAAYTPHHRRLRARFNDGGGTSNNRPPAVRRYDQIFHTLALLYVYAGITLVQTCKEDAVVEAVDAGDVVTKTGATSDGALTGEGDGSSNDPSAVAHALNACQATCPALTDAVSLYVATLELFTLSLILPLLFLPCIYLWFLRQATANQEALAELQQRLRDDDDDDFMFSFAGGGGRRGTTATAEEILQNLQTVKLVRQSEGNVRIFPTSSTTTADAGADTTTTTPTTTWEAKEGARECCICMSEFHIYDDGDDDIESGNLVEHEHEHEWVVRTPVCGHLFHAQCLASWVGGRWEEQIASGNNSSSNIRASDGATGNDREGDEAGTEIGSNNVTLERQQNRRRRARRTTCPLCRAELQRGGGRRLQSTYNSF